jgi:hypothetical protein
MNMNHVAKERTRLYTRLLKLQPELLVWEWVKDSANTVLGGKLTTPDQRKWVQIRIDALNRIDEIRRQIKVCCAALWKMITVGLKPWPSKKVEVVESVATVIPLPGDVGKPVLTEEDEFEAEFNRLLAQEREMMGMFNKQAQSRKPIKETL